MTLVILAAGMGSRFGGLKQVEPVGPNGEFIIDYSIYDAKRVGFDKVIFIIKKENEEIFKNTIGKRIEKIINVSYVFQNNDGINLPSNRVKPLGTAHAILCCKNYVNENFAIINADDFYGYDAFKTIYDSLANNVNENNYCLVGYKTVNTLTKNGSVKRGVCEIENNTLKSINENIIGLINDKLIGENLETGILTELDKDSIVSTNLIGFNPSIFEYLDKLFNEFLLNADLEKDEFLIPNVLDYLIKNNLVNINVLNTNARWMGMTYKEDKDLLCNEIKKLIENNDYPINLWD